MQGLSVVLILNEEKKTVPKGEEDGQMISATSKSVRPLPHCIISHWVEEHQESQ